MQDDRERRSDYRSDWMTVDQMAALCGVSDATVKRRAADGKPIKCRDGTLVGIESERIQRPQGWEWRVRAMTAPPALTERANPTDQENQASAQSDAQHAAQEQSRALDILDALLRANAETMERQAETIARLAGEAWESRASARIAEVRLELAEKALSGAQAELEALRAAHAECSNLSHAEASRFVQEATEQRFRADALAADIAHERATNAEQARALDDARRRLDRVPGWIRRLLRLD